MGKKEAIGSLWRRSVAEANKGIVAFGDIELQNHDEIGHSVHTGHNMDRNFEIFQVIPTMLQ